MDRTGDFPHLREVKFRGLGRVRPREVPDGHCIVLDGDLGSREMGSKMAVGETYAVYVLATGIVIHTEIGSAQQLFTVLIRVSGVNPPRERVLCAPLERPFEWSYIPKERRDLPQVWWTTVLRMVALLTA